MKLNLYMIADYLEKVPMLSFISADRCAGTLTRLSRYREGDALREDTLYLIYAGALLSLPPGTIGSFLCIGNPGIPDCGVDYLQFPREADEHLLFQEVQDIFLFFQNWELEMYALLSRNVSLKELADACLPVARNPFCLASSDLRILTYADEAAEGEQYQMFRSSDIGAYLADEEITAFKFDPDYLNGINSHEPQILFNDFYGFRHFYNNIYISGVYVARIAFCEVVHPIRQSDYLVLLKICEFFQIALQNQDISLNNHPQNFDQTIRALLEDKKVPPEAVDSVLTAAGWQASDSYFCCLMESNRDLLMHSQQTLCSQIEKALRGSMALVLQAKIFLVVNLRVSAVSKNDARSQLSVLIRENLLKVGISNCFSSFRHLPLYYEQAADALRVGAARDEMLWCYDYDTYALPILLQRIVAGRSPEAVCPEKLRLLIDYDAQHHRSYTSILKTYLEHDRSVAKTMRALYVQRATLLYQLKRIDEITGLDLDEYAVRLQLLLYFGVAAETMV